MKLTILKTGDVPSGLQSRFPPYPTMFQAMFEAVGEHFDFDVVAVNEGQALPPPEMLDGVVITGSAAGVYDDLPWLEPLRVFIRNAYAANTPMLGVCFGHQVMADALGGDVRKSEKGWGLGRQTYTVRSAKRLDLGGREAFAIACSHQDQVLAPPPNAEVFLGSTFTPNAGLVYDNGAAVSVQPHPEFNDDYALALVELRRGRASDEAVEAALGSFATPSHREELTRVLAAYLRNAAARD